MSAKIRYALARFPDLSETIKQYCADNRFFFSLCEDYGEAIEILRYWEQSDKHSASKNVSMCRDLVEDLEREILSELQRSNGN